MAVYNILQGVLPASYVYAGTTGDDSYILPISKTGTTSFLFGTYTIDSLGSGNDTLVFKATDIFNGSSSLFFPQFELSSSNTPVWTAYDQRSTAPLRVEWSSSSPGDSVNIEVWQTPTGGTSPVLAATVNNVGTYIGSGGVAAAPGIKTGAMYVQETITEMPGFPGLIGDDDRKNIGSFYVKDGSMLSSLPVVTSFNGTSVDTLAAGSFDKYIFNTINGKSSLFGPSNLNIEALEAEIRIDAGTNFSGQKYLNLAGSVGAPMAGQTNFTSVIPDVEYRLLVDLALSSGVTVKETNTGIRNWWDEVDYGDVGITSDGKSGFVNTAFPTSTVGVTLSNGNFNATGGAGSDYNVTVFRATAGVTDVYSGFESFDLTTGNDNIYYNGGFLSVMAAKGDDVWNIASRDSAAWSDLRINTGGNEFSNESTGLFVNLSGQTKTWSGVTLSGSANTGKMRDNFGTTDTFNISSGEGFSDNVRLSFETSSFSDRLHLAADGMGTIAEYRVEGSAGYDQFHLNTAVSPSTLAPAVAVTSTNLSGLLSGSGTAVLEQGTRFFDSSDYKISFAATGTGSAQKLVATLVDVSQITNVSAGGDITVSDTSGWGVGDTVVYRAGTEGVTGLSDGVKYTVAAVTGSAVRLQTIGVAPSNPITASDASYLGSTLEHIVSTSGAVDGVYNSGVVSGGYVTFSDDAGQFSRMAIRVDGKITDQTKFSFNAQNNVQEFTAGQDFGDGDLAQSAGRAAFSVDYRDLYEEQPSSVVPTGISYINGFVDKRSLGFDRLVEYAETAYVGARRYSMTEYDDTLVQTIGSSSVELSLNAGLGSDRLFVEGISSDVNQRIELNLGDQWGGRDGQYDQVEIGVSKLAQKYGSVQYIDVTNADNTDLIKFVDAEGYTLVKNTEAGTTMGSYKNFATYSIYDGLSATATSLVMQVRVTGDNYFYGPEAFTKLSDSNTSWGQVTTEGKTITANPTAVAMTANADAALLFEDTTTTPYLMGEGNDYVVTMGGDQDIALGGGNDFLSIRNYGQQLFVSGGAGVDQLGMGGTFSQLSDGTYVSDEWRFSSMDVAKAKEFMAEKYPTLAVTSDPFAWDSGPLDRVMVATNRQDGTTVYFQAEELGFSNGSVNSGNFLPPISETYDTTARSLLYTTLYGRSTNDSVNLKVADVDMALKHIGSWLNSTTLAPITTGNVLVGSHALEINAQAATGPLWFTGNTAVTNGGFKLVDIENIRLFDNAGKEVTVRVAGSSSYDSVEQAMQYANRGDVIFVAETKEGAMTGTTRAVVNMETTVFTSGGLRVAFEEGANRTVNTSAQLTVNMTGSVKTSGTDVGFFGTNANALEVLGTSNININGSALGDLIVGNKGNNVISSLAGNDIVFGGNGSDMLIGGVGDDVLVGGSSHRVTGLQHTPDEGVFDGFNLSTDATRINVGSNFEFQTGDKVIYKFAGGSGISSRDGALTDTSPLYIIRSDNLDVNGNLVSVDVRLANSLNNAKLGVALDIVSNGTATTHGVTLDNVAYTAANLAGSDYLYGGSGQDHLVATGVTGSLSTAGVRDSLTMNGGSGADTFSLFGNTGKISMFGGSGADTVEVFNNFMDTVGVNKSARMLDFAAAQDDILSNFNQTDLGTTSIESKLTSSGLTLSQLVSPPLPVVSGSGENGNYQETDNASIATYRLELGDYQLSIADLINLHQAHAA